MELRTIYRELLLGDVAPDPLCDGDGAAEMRARQDDQELLTAVTRDHVYVAHALARDFGDRTDDVVAELARARVVEALELIDVDEGAGQRVVVALGALELLGESRVQVPVIVKTGE